MNSTRRPVNGVQDGRLDGIRPDDDLVLSGQGWRQRQQRRHEQSRRPEANRDTPTPAEHHPSLSSVFLQHETQRQGPPIPR